MVDFVELFNRYKEILLSNEFQQLLYQVLLAIAPSVPVVVGLFIKRTCGEYNSRREKKVNICEDLKKAVETLKTTKQSIPKTKSDENITTSSEIVQNNLELKTYEEVPKPCNVTNIPLLEEAAKYEILCTKCSISENQICQNNSVLSEEQIKTCSQENVHNSQCNTCGNVCTISKKQKEICPEENFQTNLTTCKEKTEVQVQTSLTDNAQNGIRCSKCQNVIKLEEHINIFPRESGQRDLRTENIVEILKQYELNNIPKLEEGIKYEDFASSENYIPEEQRSQNISSLENVQDDSRLNKFQNTPIILEEHIKISARESGKHDSGPENTAKISKQRELNNIPKLEEVIKHKEDVAKIPKIPEHTKIPSLQNVQEDVSSNESNISEIQRTQTISKISEHIKSSSLENVKKGFEKILSFVGLNRTPELENTVKSEEGPIRTYSLKNVNDHSESENSEQISKPYDLSNSLESKDETTNEDVSDLNSNGCKSLYLGPYLKNLTKTVETKNFEVENNKMKLHTLIIVDEDGNFIESIRFRDIDYEKALEATREYCDKNCNIPVDLKFPL